MNSEEPKNLSRKILNQQHEPSLNMISPRMTSPKTIKNKVSRDSHPQHADETEIACSKQNQCQFQYRPKDPHVDETLFSIDSEFLKEQVPMAIDIQPEIQLQAKPQIDQLIATNIRMNRYKKAYEEAEKEQEERIKQQRLKKLSQSAKQALNGVKKSKNQTRNKWGHSIYGQESRKAFDQTENRTQKDSNKINSDESPNTKKAHLQNAAQVAQKRIQEYKQKELQRQKELQKKQQIYEKQKKLDNKKLQEVNAKIANNAAEILKQKQLEIQETKKRKEEIKIKIQELRKQSLKNCKKSKKDPIKIEEGKQQDMNMGDSQYSTFQARKQGRKMIKKPLKKKKHQKQESSVDDSKVVARTSSRRILKEKMSKTTGDFSKSKMKKGHVSDKENKGSVQNQNQEEEGKKEFKKFYVWNVPIKQEDFSLVALQKKIQEEKSLNHERKSEISFKEQAQEFLRQKERKKFEEERQKTRQEFLEQRIQEKKRQIMREFQELYENH